MKDICERLFDHSAMLLSMERVLLPKNMSICGQESMLLNIFEEDSARWSVSGYLGSTLIKQSSGFILTIHVAVPQRETMLTIKCGHLVYLKEVFFNYK